MNAEEPIPRHFLLPSHLFAHRQEHVVSTLLGSCVSVCLFDPNLGCGGINHFMLPLWNGEGLATPKFGNVAMEKLLAKLLDLGCHKEHLVAKVFGGASVLPGEMGYFNIGQRNHELALERLDHHGIRVAASQVGGCSGMKIQFNTRAGWVRLALLGQPKPHQG